MSSRPDRRRSYDHGSSRRHSGADSIDAPSRRRSIRRDGYDDDGATFTSTITEEPSEISDRRRRSSRRENDDDDTRRSSKSDRGLKDERRRGDVGGATREEGRRDSRKSGKSDRREKERGSTHALGDHDAALPQNQFPGEFPDAYAQPYRPPGLAAEYYNDHGESVQSQPGVRPNQPSVVTNAEQAHLMEPTVEPKPPPEPSSLGQIGAAASFYGDTNYENDSGHQTTPSKPPRLGSGSYRPVKHSTYGASPRSSPVPQGSMTPSTQTPGRIGFAAPAAAVVGAAAEYYAGGGGGSASAYQTPSRPPPGQHPGFTPHSAPPGIGGSQYHSNAALYGGAAALTGAAAGAYISSHGHEHHSHSHQQASTHTSAHANGHAQSHGAQMHQAHRHKHKGLFGKFVDWWRDPEAIAQYEQYTEAIGVCKYCFDPMSTPADAPRKHGYRRRTPSGGRHGSTTRVDKTYRYSSDEERRKRSGTKVALGGLAGYGVAKVGEAMYKQRHDFDDTYSVKSGQPVNQSRVSFHDEPQYERYGDVRLQRRDSDRKTKKSEKSSHKEKPRRRRSRSSSSSSSSHGISRGAAMSAGAAVAGAAMGAAALDRKTRPQSRSRSRSPTSRERYFSKRVSPMHSYVDLSATNEGRGGLFGFFTSPSANTKKGKKPKGLFNFGNDSSSSSDADLQFGAGTVRRKPSARRLRTRREKPQPDHSAAAMMGMVATGAALAAEVDRRHEKGKREHDTDRYAGRSSRHASEHRISMDEHETGGRDDEWYDTDGDAESDTSVDTALAYGGGISAAQSRESLIQDRKSTRPSHNLRERDQRMYHDGQAGYGPTTSFPNSATQTTVAPAAGAVGGWMASDAMHQDPRLPMSPLPPMREVEPRPLSDPPSKAVAPQVTRVSSTSVPLQQPQPVVPVAPFINDLGSQSTDVQRRMGREAQSERRRPRRDSSPAKLPTQDPKDPRNSVNFSLTDEQLENERRVEDRLHRGKATSSDNAQRKSADAGNLAETSTRRVEVPHQERKPRSRRSSEATRRPSDGDERVAEIERELERLYEEHRQAEERKRRRDSGLKKAAQGAGIVTAAAVTAAALAGKDSKPGSGEDSTPKRKSSLKRSRERESSPQSETQQERIARMAAQRVRSTPSPVQHDNYGSFFVPAELREHLKEHNDRAEHRDDIGANVVEIVPGAPKSLRPHPFDPFTYRHFVLEADDDPSLHPWPVPVLALVEPTPPGSKTHSVRGDETPVIEPKRTEPVEEIGESLERRESKVTWGDHDTYVYEVQTPEYERTDFTPDGETGEPNVADMPSLDEIVDEPSPSSEETQSRPGLGRTWTLEDSEAEKLEKEVPIVDDRPQISRAWTVDDKEADEIDHEVLGSSPDNGVATPEPRPDIITAEPKSQARPPSIVAEPEELPRAPSPPGQARADRSQTFYQSPFAESVSDVGAMGDFHTPARSEAESLRTIEETHARHEESRNEDDTSEPQVLEISPGPRTSKSEQRRRERASSLADINQPFGSEQRSAEDESDTASPPPVPGTDSVFDYLVNGKAENAASASVLGLGASAVLVADQVAKSGDEHEQTRTPVPAEEDQPLKPKRSSTFDESKSRRSRSGSKAGYQSDPEDWERSADKSGKPKSSSKSDIGTKSSSKSESRREVDEASFTPLPKSPAGDDLGEDAASRRSSRHRRKDFDEDSTISRKSRDEGKTSRSRRSRDADGNQDDDARSVASSDSKGKKKESGGFFSSIFSSNKSDVSTSSRKSSKSTKSESRADRGRDDRSESRRKRKSRDKADLDDVASAVSEPTRKSRRSSDPQEAATDRNELSRDQSLDDGFVSAEEVAESPMKSVREGESFLASRPEMPEPTVMDIPMGTDGVSGPTSERGPSTQPDTVASTPVKVPIELEDNGLEPPGLSQIAESRRLSAIRTSDVPSSPITTGSPTAVPLQFRRPHMSPTNQRFSMSSPVAAPSSPLSTPRTRQGRPKSTEFRNSKEFRPLYLVERQNFAKTAATEPEENLPSLPSSRTSSAHPSMEDLRAEAQAWEQSDYVTPSRKSAEMFREHGRRHSFSYWRDNGKRRESPDYLDSRSATPVPGEAQRARDQETKPKLKYEFHSPSELLQDPALLRDVPSVDDADALQSPLPSVASTDFDQDYMSARSRSLSPTTRSRSLSRGRRSASTTRSTSASWHDALTTAAAGVLAGSALGIAAHEVLGEPSDDVPPDEVATPRKFEFFPEEVAVLKEEPNSFDLQQDRSLSASAPATEQRPLEATTEEVRDTSGWKNVFAELHNRERSLNPMSQTLDVPTGRKLVSEGLMEETAPEALLPVSPLVALGEEVAHAHHSIPSVVKGPISQEGDTAMLGKDGLPRTVRDYEELIQESGSRTKKSKRDKKGKKKRTTLTLDEDLPPTPDEGVVPEQNESVLRGLSSLGVQATDQEAALDLHRSVEIAPEAMPTQPEPGVPTLPTVDDEQKDVERPHEQIFTLDDKTIDDKAHAPAEIKQFTNPLDEAFDAALQTRGLADGATVEAAYQSFHPEDPNTDGTQLTTIQEESELSTPATAQEPISSDSTFLVRRQSSKRDKRKQKQSKQTLPNDTPDADLPPVHDADRTEIDIDRSLTVTSEDQFLPDQRVFAEPTPAPERPSPFGDDFEINPAEDDVQSTTIGNSQALHKPTGERDSGQATPKKGKKDKKKKKRQSSSWEEEAATGQPETVTQTGATDPGPQAVLDEPTATDPDDVPSREVALEEEVFATPAESPRKESEDPWTLDVKPGKKSKSKSKKKGLPTAFDDSPATALEDSPSVTAPISEPGNPTQELQDSADKTQDAVFAEHIVEEAGINDMPAPVPLSQGIGPLEKSPTQVESDLATGSITDMAEAEQGFISEAAKEEHDPQSRPEEKSYTGDEVGVDTALGATATAPSVTMDQPQVEVSESVLEAAEHLIEKSDAEGMIEAVREAESGSVEDANDTDMRDMTATSVPEGPDRQDESNEQPEPETETATAPPISDHVLGHVPGPADHEHAEESVPPSLTGVPAEILRADYESPSQQQGEDFFPIVKKSKKDKKKKRTATSEGGQLVNPSQEPLVEEMITPSVSDPLVEDKREIDVPEPSTPAEAQIPVARTLDEAIPPPEAPTEDIFQLDDDRWALPGKKSKKDKKKKKRQSALAESDIASPAESATVTDEKTISADIPREVEPSDVPAGSVDPSAESVALALVEDEPRQDEDLFSVPTKKSKGKKNKRGSNLTFDQPDVLPSDENVLLDENNVQDTGSYENTVAPDLPPAAETGELQADAAATLAKEVPPENDDGFTPTTKSKKDKKNKKRRTIINEADEPQKDAVDSQETETVATTVSEQIPEPDVLAQESVKATDNVGGPEKTDAQFVGVDTTEIHEPQPTSQAAAEIVYDAAVTRDPTGTTTDLEISAIQEVSATEDPQTMNASQEDTVSEHLADVAPQAEAPSVGPSTEASILETPVAEFPVRDSISVETRTVEPPAVEAPVVHSPVPEQVPAETPAIEPPTVEAPLPQRVIVDKATDEPSTAQLAVQSPIEEKGAVETAVVEPLTGEAPIVQSPVHGTATLDPPVDDESGVETHGRSRAKEAHSDAPNAVESPIVEPVVQTQGVETPGDEKTAAIGTSDADATALDVPSVPADAQSAHGYDSFTVETSAGDHSSAESQTRETLYDEASGVTTSPLEPTAVDVPTVETPAVEAPVVETPAVEGDAVTVGGVAPEAEGEWDMPVKNWKKDKKKKRQSALAAEALESETPTSGTWEQLVAPESAPAVGDEVVGPEATLPEGDHTKPDADMGNDGQDVAAPTSKSKKDKKKKKRQSNLAAIWDDPQDAPDKAEEVVQESQPDDVEALTVTTETTREEPEAALDDSAQLATGVATEEQTPDSGEVTQVIPEESFTFTKSRKDKKKKKRQSTLVDDVIEGDAAADDSKATVDESIPISPDAPVSADAQTDENITGSRDLVYTKEPSQPDDIALADASGSQDVPDDEWAFTTTKAKKDKKKKKRQSALESVATESAQPESSETQSGTETQPEPPLAEEATTTESAMLLGGENGPTVVNDGFDDSWAPASKKKKDKKKGRKPNADEIRTVDEVSGGCRDIEVGGKQDVKPEVENVDAQAIEPDGDAALSAMAEQHPTHLADLEDAAAEPELAGPASVVQPAERAQTPTPMSLQPDEVTEPQEDPKLKAPEKGQLGEDAAERPVPPESEPPLIQEETAPPEEIALPEATAATEGTTEQKVTVSSTIDPAPEDQSLDYFSLSRKKSKKDKKKKRQVVLEEPQTSDVFETPMENATPAEPLQTPFDTPMDTAGSSFIGTEEMVPHAEEEEPTSTKTKAKKGKKGRKSVVEEPELVDAAETPLEREDPVELPLEGAEPVLEDDWSRPTTAKSKKGNKKRQTNFDDALTELTPSMSEAEPGHDEAMNDNFAGSGIPVATPGNEEEDRNILKKTKKDKKKKRQSTFEDTFAEPAVVTKEAEPASVNKAVESILEPGVSELPQEPTKEPVLADPIASQAQSDADDYKVSNKGKKNKKKKLQSIFTDIADDPVVVEERASAAFALPSEEPREATQTADSTGDAFDTMQVEADEMQAPPETTAPLDVHLPGDVLAHEKMTAEEINVAPSAEREGSDLQQLVSLEEPAADVTPAVLSESKPDVEPGQDSMEAPELPSVSTAIEPVEDQPPTTTVEEPEAQSTALPDAPGVVEVQVSQMSEEWRPEVAVTTQNEKVEPAEPSFPDTPMTMKTTEPITEGGRLDSGREVPDEQSAASGPEVLAAEVLAAEEPAPEVLAPDDFYVPKPKKSKKKKRQSTFEEPEFDSLQTEAGEPVSNLQGPPTESTAETQPLDPAPVDLTSVDATTAEQTVEEEWSMPSKKSKKAKKNRQFAFDEPGLGALQTETPDAIAEPELAKSGDTKMLDVAIGPGIQPQTVEPATGEDWGTATKKSKKDKKKKRKTLVGEEESQPSTALEETLPEASIVDEQQPDAGVTTTSAKQLERDSAFEVDMGLDTPAEAAVLLPDEQQPETEPLAPGDTTEGRLPTDSLLAGEEWATSTKKSKKDKKKKKQRLALDDIDMDESQPAIAAESAAVEAPIEQAAVDVPTGSHEVPVLELKVEHDGPKGAEPRSAASQPHMFEDVEQGSKEPLAEEPPAASSIAEPMDIVSEEPSAILSGHHIQEPELESALPGAAVECERELVPTLDEPTQVETEWPSAKKSKKEKQKSKRQSTLNSILQPQEQVSDPAVAPEVEAPLDVPQADVIADVQQSATDPAPSETQAQEEWGFSTKKSKKGKKGRSLALGDGITTPGSETPRSTDQFDSAIQTPLGRTTSPEPMEDVKEPDTPAVQVEANDGYFVPASRKKSKKDKKKKSLFAWSADDQPAEEKSEPGASTPALAAEPSQDTDHRLEANDEPLASMAKDVLDEAESFNDREAPKTTEHLEMATAVSGPEPIHDRSVSGEQYETLMGDISGPVKSKLQVDHPARDIDVDMAQAPKHPDLHPEQSADLQASDENLAPTTPPADALPEQTRPMVMTDRPETVRDLDAEPAMQENVPPAFEDPVQRKKSKKDKKAKKERRVFEFAGTEIVPPPVAKPEETDLCEPDVMEIIPKEPVEPTSATASTREPPPPEDMENHSDVSESTRERRRRRRSPPVWSGEEPEDLPRDRALTPPPEHDDIMDTALGVAAGLGFGGREPEATRESPPKPSSPARQASTGWSFARLAPGVTTAESNRDSGVQFDSPVLATDHFSSTRDSGFIPSPAIAHVEFDGSRDDGPDTKLRPPRPRSPTSSSEDVAKTRTSKTRHEDTATLETPRRKPSPVESTSKDRTSVLFNSSPAVPSPLITSGIARSPQRGQSPLRRSPSIHGHHHSREELRQPKAKVIQHHEDSEQLASNLIDQSAAAPSNRSVFDAESRDRPFTPARSALGPIQEDSPETAGMAHSSPKTPPGLPAQRDAGKNDVGALGIVTAAGAAGLAAAALASRDSGAKSLGRSKSRTSSLRNLRGNSISPFDPANFTSGSSQDPVNARDTGKAAVRDRDMADIYVRLHASNPCPRSPMLTALQDGYGSYPGSPRSPTRPPSVRRRQSMQQIKDLEARLDQLASENRALVEAKIVAEQHLEHAHFETNRSENASAAFSAQLQERDAEIARLRQEVASLVATHESLKKEHEQSLLTLRQEHDQALSQWQGSSRELETLRSRHTELSTGMESIVRHEIDSALAEKNAEIQRLRDDLEVAREKVRELQSQILERPVDDVVIFHDEDYFEQACQKLCQQVQGWVLRFSKFSDLKLCRTTSEVREEKIVDKFDNAILDGSDVDVYLADRVKRRDVFMSVVMTMIWEYVFTRYLFGMDREQRQKLKQLEKNLGEVGPTSAVHQWRALTLTLLSKRESFKAQKESDTEAVAIEIFSTLSRFLPPPQNLEDQIVGSLRNVMRTAVELSIEMRTQRAEYIMLPPLQPEYDTNGDLARKVYFNASLMNERSGETTSNEELERAQAVVRMVLFPLVVKKGDDNGVGDEEIVVCPAQVLIARPDKAKKPRSSTRHVSGGSDGKSLRAISTHSLAMSGLEGNENMF
ncbi:hypothetical protein A1O7_03680 [Cladophialophora yegresii CBS 114405]|uniref:Involucrin repeat protein n=1 Tax=Cladophialophora yegresii CBS 114405 TaxID=1182544 RepID=W9W5J0_9EURO|nr:uncharacterized protein A1O7_03680 [Cladophialophora yegresii CBS 114405]EXJ63233.1 hypothetical protein A1O7_03680 [Cladophialophora yegresii CBS 114405]